VNKQTPEISIIMPAYNEGSNIYDNLVETVLTLDSTGISYEIILVDDGSEDQTANFVRKAIEKYPQITLLSYEQNGGKGKAIMAGFNRARGTLVAFLDADLELHPKQLIGLLSAMKENDADIVIGSKRHPESKISYPLKRRVLSKCYNIIIRALFNLQLTDTQPGIKVFKHEVLKKEFSKVVVKRYAFDLEVLVSASNDGYKIIEAPIELIFNRTNGSRINISDVIHMFVDTLGVFTRLRITHYYG